MRVRIKGITRLYDGSGLLMTRALDSSLTAKIIGGVVAWNAGPELLNQAHQQPYLTPAIAGAWCWAAWSAAAPQETPGEECPEPAGETFLEALHRLIPGPDDRLHVAEIAEHLGLPATAVNEELRALGITPKGVRSGGRGSSTGVHRSALPPLPRPLSAPLLAPLTSNNNTNNTDDEWPQEGYLIKDRPGSPGSGDIIWRDEP